MIPYWLNVANNPSASKGELAIAQAVNTLHPFIISHQEEKLEWENTELLVVKSDHDLVEAVKKIKQQPGKDLGSLAAFARPKRLCDSVYLMSTC
jgi:hypothetical protein